MHHSKLSCPSFQDHTPSPEGYIQWHSWAKNMMKTHKQRKCSGCGLFVIWEPRKRDGEYLSPPFPSVPVREEC